MSLCCHLPEHRVLRHVAQHVVHPPHVPLEGEPEAAEVDRPAHRRPRGGFLRDRHGAGVLLVDDDVELAEELDGLEVLAAAEPVRHPLPFLARVVEVEHRRHRVHAQAVERGTRRARTARSTSRKLRTSWRP